MKIIWRLLVSIIILFIGYFFGKLDLDFPIGVDFESINNFFKESKVFVEVLYFGIASLLIPIAYIQYRNEKKKEKRGAVEYTHKLFRQYSEEILAQDKKINQKFLKELSLESDADKINEFNNVLNKLDAFAAAFIHGIADLEAGKRMMGNTYCDQIQSYLPAIKRISRENYREGLENLFGLWEKWKETNG